MDAKFLHANNEDTDQTAQMGRLICVFVRQSEGLQLAAPTVL